MSTTLTIRLKRASKIYHEGELVTGTVVISSQSDVKHDGFTLHLEGSVDLQMTGKTFGIFEAFSNSVKPLSLISQSIELAPPGKIPSGVTEIPFEIPLLPRHQTSGQYPGLLETYHGVFISVIYALRCAIKRSFLSKPLSASCQIVVQYVQSETAVKKPVICEISPQSIRASSAPGATPTTPLPQLRLALQLDSTVCAIDRPFTGQICVKECTKTIKSIELQLVRVETCGCSEGYSRDATEIQNIQLGEGDVCRGIDIPIYMVFPRLFTCPTISTHNFKIEFEVNIAVIFQDDYLVTENFPILLVRSR